MCGIIGYVGKKRAAPIILECLKRLEYRGYDSAGIATINGGKLFLKKDKGFINDVILHTDLPSLPGQIGIGHTRWATHGVPSMRNAHPHTSCDEKIAVIHNGIIENYLDLKNDLLEKGHKFKSETDTEVFAHLIEENFKKKKNFESAVSDSLKKIHGAFAFVVLNADEPDKIIVARNNAPLIIGLGDGENFVASDIPAFLSETRRAVILENGEYAVIAKESAVVKEIKSSRVVKKQIQNIKWSAEAAEKGGYEYFALKEINEIPRATEDTLAALPEIEKIAHKVKKFMRNPRFRYPQTKFAVKKIIFVAAGTSYHAALIGKYLFENLCKIQCEAVLASEFSWSLANIVDKNTLIIAISQSGETADTLLALEDAKLRGAKVLAISNVIGSSITREADFNVHTNAGPEIAVIATKTFVTQLIVLYALAFYLAGKNPAPLKKIPALQAKTLSLITNIIKETAEKIKSAKDIYFLGRGISYPLILEGALKLKEISYIHAEGMPAGELKHGTLSLIEENVPVIFSLTPESHEKTISNMQEVKARSGFIIAITNEKDTSVKEHANIAIKVPEVENPLMYPLLQILPLQLLAYYTTVARGLSPDKPRHLAKSVTVE
ncbi:TPA: glutamine--fructose-6-phosphate transaminase (isomerizing) [archaeon]|uniref:Glutamine--fructose-6-phosphate aminotransferase [isomerizing] n=1 Tax=Candidatus Naiadarchaeum limnaeum TaxID=2756139 RepID=A0A832XGJ7_9ARCH|nr:glutamine--fructose-6-phosphate transaminase (isomerizing) [Candidatus Naiadarchaeales archaeon SRR2090153.bin1042]HIK00264.1 glutamine--fructose-6-phosphate transaminase (isomerizing) [Candidatus Naiadarchaeum limnaeum]